jgi:hypothetical protein
MLTSFPSPAFEEVEHTFTSAGFAGHRLTLWMQANFKDGTAAAQIMSRDEWLVPAIESSSGQWKTYKFDVPAWFDKTFRTSGFQYAGILGFRLRGSLVIADINCN